MAGELVTLVALIIGVGVLAQVLSDRLRVPSVVFLLAAGVVLGPEVTGLLSPATFGSGLSAIVGLSVAIIVFEGAFHVRVEKLREAPAATLRLVTLGAAIALLGTALAVHFLLDVGWLVSFLVGALLVATGPTVIAPILEVVPVRDRVGTALDTEGIVNDVTAAILAVVIFETIIAPEASGVAGLVGLFAQKLGIGLLVGLAVAAAVYYMLRYVDLSPGNAPQNARLLVLAGALVAYGAAEAIPGGRESGIAAVATAGIVLGNADLPYESEIESFKGDLTLLVLSFVFIALAALLRFETLVALGAAGIGVVVVVALVIRPLLVFVSTYGGQFTAAERTFMSLVGPRGIIPASVATLFAIELRAQGLDDAANVLVGTVFLTIFLTVLFQAGLARQIAEQLDVIPMRVIVIGGGKVGRALANRLGDRGENVVLVEEDVEIVEVARNAGHTVHHGDGTDTEVLRAAGAENAKVIVAATGDDDANLLVAQLSNQRFDPDTVLARVNDPDNVAAFEELGVRAVSSVLATAQAIDNYVERPTLANWIGDLGDQGDVQEIEVTSTDLVGEPIREIGPQLPAGVIIALVSRNGDTQVPDADFVLEDGDRITLIGDRSSVRNAMSFCHPS
jgi:NhaP-type Na+/H+ or K+/H+ antiporter/K+/H+ antiporter YhaU regulatory subunit KhtT